MCEISSVLEYKLIIYKKVSKTSFFQIKMKLTFINLIVLKYSTNTDKKFLQKIN